MIKKIKDLTYDEIDDICNNHPFCDKCPFATYNKNNFTCLAKILDIPYLVKALEEEVEVE